MSDMTIAEFCDRYGACQEGRAWALANCRDMRDAWETLRPDWLLWVATRQGVLTDRELRMFAAWSARQVQHLMTDHRSIAALDVAERRAHGHATDKELAAARAAALDAARDAAGDAGWAAAWAAARNAAGAAAWAASGAAAWAASGAAAWAASGAASGEAAWAAQSAWLRANTQPDFANE